MNRIIYIICTLLISLSILKGNIINVPNDQPTIQAGIDSSSLGDTVVVHPGIYIENIDFGGKNILVGSLFLTSGDTSHITQTIIDGNNIENVVKFIGGEDSTAILVGFTITNGIAGVGINIYGGGINCLDSSPTLKYLNVINNTGTYGGGICFRNSNSKLDHINVIQNESHYGGGIYADSSNLIFDNLKFINNNAITYHLIGKGGGIYFYNSTSDIDNVTFYNNTGMLGGGIYIENSPAKINNVIISNNNATFWGGGIYCRGSNLELSNISIENNKAERNFDTGTGGGIYIESSYSLLEDVSIIRNSAIVDGGGIYSHSSFLVLDKVTISRNQANRYGGGIAFSYTTHVNLINSILWFNSPQQILFQTFGDPNITAITHSNIQGGFNGITSNNNGSIFWLEGNINTDPMFVDTSNSNYNLHQSSPCIDSGIQDTILLYNNGQDTLYIPAIAFMGIAPDMGAFEFDPATLIENKPNFLKNYVLCQNYPNPFNASTKIKFELPETEKVKIEIFNLLGQKIETLLNKPIPAGSHQVEFNARNLPSGVYLYRIVVDSYGKAGGFQEVKKMILLR
jgi:predicted outer membrane repeat protein